MKARTFTNKIYRWTITEDGTSICTLLEVRNITVSDLSVNVHQVNSFVCGYVRSSRSSGQYFVETSYNNGRVMCFANISF